MIPGSDESKNSLCRAVRREKTPCHEQRCLCRGGTLVGTKSLVLGSQWLVSGTACVERVPAVLSDHLVCADPEPQSAQTRIASRHVGLCRLCLCRPRIQFGTNQGSAHARSAQNRHLEHGVGTKSTRLHQPSVIESIEAHCVVGGSVSRNRSIALHFHRELARCAGTQKGLLMVLC